MRQLKARNCNPMNLSICSQFKYRIFIHATHQNQTLQEIVTAACPLALCRRVTTYDCIVGQIQIMFHKNQEPLYYHLGVWGAHDS